MRVAEPPAQGGGASDRRPADAPGAGQTGGARPAQWRATAAVLPAGGEAGGDPGRPLCPRPPVARRQLKFLRTRLGRLIRDIARKIEGDAALAARFRPLLLLAQRVLTQEQRQRGRKVYALHAPEVECILGSSPRTKGKARAPYEFGCKVSVATPATRPRGGQFVLHARALHRNPFDGHTLKAAIADVEAISGVAVKRIHVDKGYRGHDHPDRFKVWITGQVRRVTAAIRKEMRRRAAIEPVIGHLKAGHRMDRNYLKGFEGDRANAVLAAAGYNFRLLLRWLALLLRALIQLILPSSPPAAGALPAAQNA